MSHTGFHKMAFLAALVAGQLGCGGSKGGPKVDAPGGLSYAASPATFVKGVAITALHPHSTGGTVESYAVSPQLPAGLTIDPATGVVSGTPAALSPLTAYTVTAANAGGDA